MWGPDGETARHQGGDSGPLLRRRLPGGHRRLQASTAPTTPRRWARCQRRPDGAGGRGVRHRTTRRSRSSTPAPCAWSTRHGNVVLEHDGEAGDIWRMCQTKDVPIRDWVKLAVNRARATGSPAIFWLDEPRAHDAQRHREGQRVPERARHRRARHPDHDAGRRDKRLARARPRRQGHDLGHRQRAARLPDRPVPDPRAGHQREDAVDRPADAGRRPVRDRRGRLGAEARAAARQGELSALGLASANSWRWPISSRICARRPTTRRPRCSAEPLDPATGTFLENDKSPGRKLGSIDNRGSHFYLALYWARALAGADRRRRAGRRRLRPSPSPWAIARRRSSRSSSTYRARRSTSVATTAPTTTRPPP